MYILIHKENNKNMNSNNYANTDIIKYYSCMNSDKYANNDYLYVGWAIQIIFF